MATAIGIGSLGALRESLALGVPVMVERDGTGGPHPGPSAFIYVYYEVYDKWAWVHCVVRDGRVMKEIGKANITHLLKDHD